MLTLMDPLTKASEVVTTTISLVQSNIVLQKVHEPFVYVLHFEADLAVAKLWAEVVKIVGIAHHTFHYQLIGIKLEEEQNNSKVP